MEIREAKDLLNLKWRHLTKEELEDIPCQVNGEIISYYYCTEKHIEVFLRKVIKNISREFEIPVDDVTEIFIQENESFYMIKKDIFIQHSLLNFMDAKMRNMLSYLTVPEMPNVDKVLKEYKRLSREQKKEFKARI